MSTDPRYPIGKYSAKESYTPDEVTDFKRRIASLPSRMEAVILNLTPSQLDTPYREGGWTVRQVVHHVADSHMNAYIRVKWALTEPSPTVKTYDEKGWAGTPETKSDPALSLALLKALHAKWIVLLNGLSPDEISKSFVHPVSQKSTRIDQLMAMYAWHGDHHLAHITTLKQLKNW